MSKNDGEVELPPLPDRFDSVSVDDFTGQRLSVYTASQMEAYARAAIAALQHKVTPLALPEVTDEDVAAPLPEHWRMAIKERGIENPKALDWIEQRARELAKVAKC